jgi:hypothetical protein
MNPAVMLNLLGFLLRIVQFPNAAIASWIGWLIYLAGIVIVCVLWRRSNVMNGKVLGLSILIAIVTAPVLHLHDLTLLILPLLFIVQDGLVTHFDSRWVLLPLVASFLLLTGIVVTEVYYIVPYLLFGILAYLLITSGKTLKRIASLST